jgi:hypothetical protein
MRLIALTASIYLLSACAAPPPITSDQRAALLKGAPLVVPTAQDELNCRMEGIAAAMLSESRDLGLTPDAAIAHAQGEFAKLAENTEADRLAGEYVRSRLRPVAQRVYSNGEFQPATAMHLIRTSCAMNIALRGSDVSKEKELQSQALVCQRLYPVDPAEKPPTKLQLCLRDSVVRILNIQQAK